MGGDKLYFQIFQTIFFLMAYWKLAGPGVGWMARVGSPHPGCPLLPSWACSAFPGGCWGPSQLGVSPLPPGREGTVAPLVHPRVGMVTCSVPWPGLCPHPAPAQLPWAPGGHRHPGHRAPTPALPSAELPPAAAMPPSLCPMAFNGQWICFCAPSAVCPHSLGGHGGLPALGLGLPRRKPCWGHPEGGSKVGVGGHRPGAGVAAALTPFALLSLAPLLASPPSARPWPPAAGTALVPRTAPGMGHPKGWGHLGGACTLLAKETNKKDEM